VSSLSALSPDGRCLAVAHGSSVRIAEQGPASPPTAVLELPDPAVALSLSHGRLFAMTRAGVLVMADRRGALELRRRIGPRGVGVGCYGDHVVAFASQGWLRWRVDDGGPEGRWGKERFSPADDVVSGACRGDGRVAVLTASGELRLHDAEDRRRAIVEVPGGTRVVPGGPAGWFVACGGEVVQVKPSRRVRPVVVCDTPVRQLAASADGRTLAVTLGDEVIGLWSVSERVPRARVQVFDRRVVGLSFGPGEVVGVGLDLADGNWVDLRTRRISRTQPPIGLVRRTWGVALTMEEPLSAQPAVAPEDRTVGASHSFLRPPAPRWTVRAEVAGLVALGVVGLLTGWMFGQAVTP